MKADDWSYTPFRYGSYTKGPYRLIVKRSTVDLYVNGICKCAYANLEDAITDVELDIIKRLFLDNMKKKDVSVPYDNNNLSEDNI